MFKNNKNFIFSIITYNKKNSFKIHKLYIKSTTGYITILPNHDNLITVIEPSNGFFETKNKTSFRIDSKGILSFSDNKAELIIDKIIIYS